MLPPRPLRTGRETFASYGSSLPQRPSRDAACPISSSWLRGSAGDSWRATTPGCRTSSSHRNSALPDGGRATAVLPPAALAGTPDTCHLDSSIKSRSGPSRKRVTQLPGHPGSRPPCCWQSQLRLAPGLPSLGRRLRSAGSFVPAVSGRHVPVGYCWQNSRCCQSAPRRAAQLHRRLRVARSDR